MYKKVLLCLALTICFGMAGCEKDNNAIDTSNNQTTNEDMQIVTENTVSNNENSQADTMLDEFIAGEKAAFHLNSEESFFITDLNMYPEEWGLIALGKKWTWTMTEKMNWFLMVHTAECI